MGVKVGRIVNIDEPPTGRKAVYRITLDTGKQVYVPRQFLDDLPSDVARDKALVFVERGLLGRVEWVGTIDAVATGVASGMVKPHEALAAGLHADGSLPSLDETLDTARRDLRR